MTLSYYDYKDMKQADIDNETADTVLTRVGGNISLTMKETNETRIAFNLEHLERELEILQAQAEQLKVLIADVKKLK